MDKSDERPTPPSQPGTTGLAGWLAELMAKATPGPLIGESIHVHKFSEELWSAPMSIDDEEQEWQWGTAFGETKEQATVRRDFIVAPVNAFRAGALTPAAGFAEAREMAAKVAESEVARHNTNSGFDSSAAYTAAARIAVAIRSLVPGGDGGQS